MARQRDVDWSDWKGCVEQPEHPLSRPLNKNIKNGSDSINIGFNELAASILKDRPPQPTNEQLFGGGVVTEEVAKARQKQWEDTFKTLSFREPIDYLNKSKIDRPWGYGKSFNQLLKEELSDKEMAERNLDVNER